MLKKIIGSVLCGGYISIGATAFLVCENAVAGALFFTTGILLVSVFYNMLFTRVIALYAYKEYSAADMAISLAGNTVGCTIYAGLIRLTRLNGRILPKVESAVETKLADGYASLFILAVLCGFMVGCACLTGKSLPDNRGTALALSSVFVTAFVICGFEHIVADAFYFAFIIFNNGFDRRIPLAFAVIALGNLIGGAATGFLDLYRRKGVKSC